jgi:ABC-type transporter Mla subunit MlaD
MTSDEVTQEYVDLGSQLKNLEATENELRELMTAVREHSKKASEVLEMSQQLTTVRGQIEQIRGRMRYLEQMTSYATATVELIPDAVAKPVVEAGWQPVAVARDAARALTNLMRDVANAAIWLLIYALPIVLLLVIVAAITWKVLRRMLQVYAERSEASAVPPR